MSSAHHTHTHTHLHASHTHKHVLKSESKFSNTATAKSDTNINTNTSPHTLLTQSHTRTQLHIAERKWVMHSLPLKRPSSSGRAVWQHYLRDGGLNKLPPTLLATLTGAAPPCVWRLMQQPSRTGQITDEHASLLKTWRHTHTHKYMCWHVHVSWPNIFNGSEGWGAPRADANVNMHSNGGAASRAGVNVTKCCQTFARMLAWQRQNANVHTQFQVCVRALCVWTEREATENQSA